MNTNQITTNKKRKPFISRSLVYIFSAIIIFDLVLIIGFVRYSDETARHSEIRDNIRKITDILDIVRNTLPNNEALLLSTLKYSNILMSISKKPKWHDMRLDTLSLWQINSYLKKNYRDPLTFSYPLKSGAWLNLSIAPVAHFSISGLLLILLAVFMTFIILSYAWAVDRFTTSINDITRRTKHLGLTLTPSQIPIYGPNIVRRAMQSINEMQNRITQLTKERITTIAALSHDIKTPLTRLKLRMQLHLSEADQEKCSQDFSEIENLLRNTFYYAKQEYLQEPKKKFDIIALLQSMVDDLAELGKKISFNSSMNKAICRGQLNNIKRAFNNIISNGLSYGDEVIVNIEQLNENLNITFSDDGPGLPEDKLEKVFEAFYREESSRSRQTGGAGLGLAIAKKLITEHSGTIKLQNRIEKGLDVIITLPVLKN